MGWQIFQFGQFYLDGIPRRVPNNIVDNKNVPCYVWEQGVGRTPHGFDIADNQGQYKITWIKPDGMNLFVADRALINVNWDDLDKVGLIGGKVVTIGGKQYLCRVPKVGVRKGVPNEWDSILDATEELDSLWHWGDMYFWGAEESVLRPGSRVIRGSCSARYWNRCSPSEYISGVGFRPVLEPLPSAISDLDTVLTLEGQQFALSQLQGAKENIFYPSLTPIVGNPFKDIADGTSLKMYTLLCGKEPVPQGNDVFKIKRKKAANLTLSEQYYGDEFLISWVISNGIAITAKPILQF